MRILYHHRTLGDGAEGIHVSSMVGAWRELGHDVRVAAMIGQHTNIVTARTRILQNVTRFTPRLIYELLEAGYSLPGSQVLARSIRASRPDLIYERYVLFNMAGVMAARRFSLPLILEVNAPLAWERAQYERLTLKRSARLSERMICSRADKVVVVSTPLKNHFVGEGVPAERITVLPNGADPARFRPIPEAGRQTRDALGLSADDVVIGFSGILRPWHGVELLVEAVAQLEPDARERTRVLIVGDGPSRPHLEQLASQRGLGRHILFTGRVAHEQVPAYLATFDVGVSPRATFYASPMKVPEYMAMAMAVVAPRMANLTDLIDDNRTGLLFEPEKPEHLAVVLGRLVASPQLRLCLGQAARQEIVEHRTWRHVADRALGLVFPVASCA
jgi:glycosyltransferase involved in cell wall biosynthesis